jgi:hypothetical protein
MPITADTWTARYVTSDGYIHDFNEDSLQDPTITAFVPWCQARRRYPDKRFFRSEVRPVHNTGCRCPYCAVRMGA